MHNNNNASNLPNHVATMPANTKAILSEWQLSSEASFNLNDKCHKMLCGKSFCVKIKYFHTAFHLVCAPLEQTINHNPVHDNCS